MGWTKDGSTYKASDATTTKHLRFVRLPVFMTLFLLGLIEQTRYLCELRKGESPYDPMTLVVTNGKRSP